MPRGVKMSLVSDEAIWNVLHSNFHTIPKHVSKLTKHEKLCMQNNQLPTRKLAELVDNSKIVSKVLWCCA